MKELCIFIDESGDFGEYSHLAPYYIVTLVLHDQSSDVPKQFQLLEGSLSEIGYSNHSREMIRRGGFCLYVLIYVVMKTHGARQHST